MTSKIKVDNIENQCGGAVVTKCGGTTTISGSVVKANNIQASDGGNLVSQSGTTITLGASGDTINLASGASQSGFGRTGTVDWQTTPKTSATFTAANGEGYFVNTTSNAITMTMPSGSAGAIVAIQDYNKTFDSNALTVTPASGEKINGGVADGNLIISTEGQGLTFIYVDATVGWKTVHENEFTAGGSTNLIATGGTITTSGDYKIHTFTSPGTFTVCSVSGTPAENTVSYMVVAGGGGGGAVRGGAAGAGGFREYKGPADSYTASPLDGNPGGTAVTVTAQGYPITVGAGGTGARPASSEGSDSVFSTITSTGGGRGGSREGAQPSGQSGGSGGAGGADSVTTNPGGNGNTPPVSPPQGNPGGGAENRTGGGGGGATAGGGSAPGPGGPGGTGGAGATTSINGSPTAFAGGGGGGTQCGTKGSGGAGGGGAGGQGETAPANAATVGTTNTGGGGGGGGDNACGANGGSGIVVIRYKYQ